MADKIETNVPFERVPTCACDPGTGEAPHYAEIFALRRQVADLTEALKPFSYYYELNDCHERKPDDALEVPIHDLKTAHDLLNGAH